MAPKDCPCAAFSEVLTLHCGEQRIHKLRPFDAVSDVCQDTGATRAPGYPPTTCCSTRPKCQRVSAVYTPRCLAPPRAALQLPGPTRPSLTRTLPDLSGPQYHCTVSHLTERVYCSPATGGYTAVCCVTSSGGSSSFSSTLGTSLDCDSGGKGTGRHVVIVSHGRTW